jgi:hypothetical protein
MRRDSNQERSQEVERNVDSGVDVQELLIPVYRIRHAKATTGEINFAKKGEVRKHLKELNDKVEILIDEASDIIDESTEIRALLESLENIWEYTEKSLRTL